MSTRTQRCTLCKRSRWTMGFEACCRLPLASLLVQDFVCFVEEKVEKLVGVLVHVAAEELVVALDALHKSLWLDDACLFLLRANLFGGRRVD